MWSPPARRRLGDLDTLIFVYTLVPEYILVNTYVFGSSEDGMSLTVVGSVGGVSPTPDPAQQEPPTTSTRGYVLRLFVGTETY